MGIFNPQVDLNIRGENPTGGGAVEGATTRAGIQGLGSVLGILDAATQPPKERSFAERKFNMEQGALSRYQEDLLTAEGLRREGNTRKAEALETKAALDFQRGGGDLGDSNTKAAFTAITGREQEEMLRSRDQIRLDKIVNTKEFNDRYLAVRATNPNLKPEEAHNLALSSLAQTANHQMILSNQTIEWQQGKREAFFSIVQEHTADVLGSITELARTGQTVPLETISAAKAEWAGTKAALLGALPSNLTSDQRKEVETQLSAFDEVIRVAEASSSPEGIQARVLQPVLAAIHEKKDWTPGTKVLASQMTSNLGEAFASGNLNVQEVSDIYKYILHEDFDATDLTNAEKDPTGRVVLPEAVTEEAKRRAPEDNFKAASSIGTLMDQTDFARLEADPNYKAEWIKSLTVGVTAMTHLGEEQRQFTKASHINKVFNGSIAEGIQRLSKSDSATANNLRDMIQDSLDSHYVLANQQLQNNLSTGVFSIINGQVDVDPEKVRKELGGDALSKMQTMADKHYGGSLRNLVVDRGLKLRGTEDDLFAQGGADFASYSLGRSGYEAAKEQLQSMQALEERMGTFQGLSLEGGPKLNTDIRTNPDMNPLFGNKGASHLTKDYAESRMNNLLSGPFAELQTQFGGTLMINDAIAKKGTSRETSTKGSRHFHGDAIDISVAGMSDADKQRLVESAMSVGFQGFGFGRNILHIDMGGRRAWAYGNKSFGGMSVEEIKAKIRGGKTPRPDLKSTGGSVDYTVSEEADPTEGDPSGLVEFGPIVPDMADLSLITPEQTAQDTTPTGAGGTVDGAIIAPNAPLEGQVVETPVDQDSAPKESGGRIDEIQRSRILEQLKVFGTTLDGIEDMDELAVFIKMYLEKEGKDVPPVREESK